jgi:alpha-D-ribose 1-methylphosphonate 5-triphosphate synthase subunit PhnI
MYVAVKGGEAAILASLEQVDTVRRGDPGIAELSTAQIREQLRLAVARVMSEGSLYDPDLAALAIKQAAGDLIEAVFLLRAYRTTLPRFGASAPIDTATMLLQRRISAAFKDVPGGQMLGATYDYTQRLLDFALMAAGTASAPPPAASGDGVPAPAPHIADFLATEGLLARECDDGTSPPDLTREPLTLPAGRAARLQNLARGDEGFLLGLGYSTQRGYGNNHPFAGEIRHGWLTVEFMPAELGFAIDIGDIEVTECELFNQFKGSPTVPPQFTRGYGLVFGHAERKAMAMALVDRAMQAEELGEPVTAPAQDIEFVLYHSDNVEASGFVQHLKLPHYVDFQSELELVRRLRREYRQCQECSGEPE